MSRPSRAGFAIGALLLVGASACSGAATSDSVTGTTSQAAGTSSVAPVSSAPPATAAPGPPVTGPGPCPYLDEGYIEETVGQRMGRVETITVSGQPAPDCVFYRPDESAAVAVDLTPYPDAVSAQNAALALVTAAAMPVTDIGDYGGVIISANQTLLAVTVGPLLVAVTTNQESSLQAREVATTVLAGLPPA